MSQKKQGKTKATFKVGILPMAKAGIFKQGSLTKLR
jgi:hypothetical protein